MKLWEKIEEKAEAGERLSSEEGAYLFRDAELHQLAGSGLAALEREAIAFAHQLLESGRGFPNLQLLE